MESTPNMKNIFCNFQTKNTKNIHLLLYTSKWFMGLWAFQIGFYKAMTYFDSAKALTVCFPAGRVNGPMYCMVHFSTPTFGNGSGFVPFIV